MSWHGEALAFLALLLLASSRTAEHAAAVSSDGLVVPSAALVVLTVALVAPVQASLGIINFWGDAVVITFYLVICAAALILGYSSMSSIGLEREVGPGLCAIATTLLLGAAVSSVIASVQVLELYETSAWFVRMESPRRPGGNLGQPNHLATLIVMGIASALYLHHSKRLATWQLVAVFLLLAAALAATESRTGALSFLLLCGWWVAKRRQARLQLPAWMVAVAFAGFVGFFVAWPKLMVSSGVFETGAQINAQGGTRLVVWPQLLETVSLRPWWGWGLREVSEAQNAVASSYSSSEPFTYAHNIILDLAVGVGVPISVVVALLISTWCWRRVQCVDSAVSWYCVAAVLPFGVHSLLEFPHAYSYFLIPVMYLLGVLEANSEQRPVLRLRTGVACAILAVLTTFGAWSVVEYLRVEEDFRVARFEALRIGETPNEYERPAIHLLSQLDALLAGARIDPRPDMTSADLELARSVALRFPWPATQNRYALSLALNGNPKEALRQLKVIRALHGERAYRQVKANWVDLAAGRYPSLAQFPLP